MVQDIGTNLDSVGYNEHIVQFDNDIIFRRTLTCTKGVSIGKFLEMVRNEFKVTSTLPPERVITSLTVTPQELRSVSVDNLLFIKEDLIIPQHIRFVVVISAINLNSYRPNAIFIQLLRSYCHESQRQEWSTVQLGRPRRYSSDQRC